MDSLNGALSGCNFVVNPTCITQTTTTSTNGLFYQHQSFTHTQSSPYFNAFNDYGDNPNPMYV